VRPDDPYSAAAARFDDSDARLMLVGDYVDIS
jgi:hypothetical protein